MADDSLVREAKQFLFILTERISDLSASAGAHKKAASSTSFSEYQKFRDLSAGCLTFTIIIQNRVERISASDPALATQFGKRLDILTIQIWGILLGGALEFFQVISQHHALPLGTRDVFTRELRTLHEAGKIFREPRYAEHADKSMHKNAEVAEKILFQIIEKAPSLLEIAV